MTIRILIGDVRDQLRLLPADFFDCVVTSPPYWGLRDYGVAGQIGLEQTLGEHIDVMVDVFDEVRRVMKPTATLWLNYGDCYATSPNGRRAADIIDDDRTFRDKPFSTIGAIYDPGYEKTARYGKSENFGNTSAAHGGRIMAGGNLKPKDLCMIPNRIAIALQEAGWWVRSEIIWHKPNPMPESITDRPTTSHEKIWLLTKSERYFYDAEAIREPVSDSTNARLAQDIDSQISSDRANGGARPNRPMKAVGRNSRANVDRVPKSRKLPPKDEGRDDQGLRIAARFGGGAGWREEGLRDDTRNSRNVWTIATAAFSEAHFATFPPAIPERCIKAGCPKDGHVLDPFGGAGTTGLVADRLQRHATLIELNPEYAALARRRIEGDAPLFVEATA